MTTSTKESMAPLMPERLCRCQLPIIFTVPYDGNRWNLAFGDVQPDGEINDSIITNNHDVTKVIGTVAQAALLFLEKHPGCSLVIFPVDEKRKWLYNLVFRRRLPEIQPFWEIWGKWGQFWEIYQPELEYDAFEIVGKRR